jgi:hypothetical protein
LARHVGTESEEYLANGKLNLLATTDPVVAFIEPFFVFRLAQCYEQERQGWEWKFVCWHMNIYSR